MRWLPRWIYYRDDIHGKEGEGVYMTRRIFFRHFRYHVFHRGDADLAWHDHPFKFVTFPLNDYYEEVLFSWAAIEGKIYAEGLHELFFTQRVRRFRLHWRAAEHAHRVLDPKPGKKIRTLIFIYNHDRDRWGFWQFNPETWTMSWTHWKKFLGISK